jgi:nucleotide-binding universal stress UspA family protein
MNYKTIMAHLELNGDNEGVLSIAGHLAEQFGARVIGIAAAQPVMPLYEEGFSMADVAAKDRAELRRELVHCRTQFRKALEERVPIEWRSAVAYELPADYIAEQARAADLIITGKDIGASLLDNSRRVNIGSLALKAGRPVLIVPQGIRELALRHVFLGWRDNREARRAAMDSLPLLRAAENVTVVEVTSERERPQTQIRLEDVASWLKCHGVSATALALGTSGNQVGHLHAELLNRKCDLLVAGAYGHSRLGEWVFGGVTEDVLLDPDFCVLLSH